MRISLGVDRPLLMKPKFIQLPMQGRPADAEQLGGVRHVAARPGKRPLNHSPLAGGEVVGFLLAGDQVADRGAAVEVRRAEAEQLPGGAGGADDQLVSVDGQQRIGPPLGRRRQNDASPRKGAAEQVALDAPRRSSGTPLRSAKSTQQPTPPTAACRRSMALSAQAISGSSGCRASVISWSVNRQTGGRGAAGSSLCSSCDRCHDAATTERTAPPAASVSRMCRA